MVESIPCVTSAINVTQGTCNGGELTMYDGRSDFLLIDSIPLSSIASDTNGSGVDLSGYHSALVLVSIDKWLDGTHDFSLEESDNDSDYDPVDANDMSTGFSTVDDDTKDGTVQKVAYLGNKRYIRVVDTVVGGVGGLTLKASVVKRRASHVV